MYLLIFFINIQDLFAIQNKNIKQKILKPDSTINVIINPTGKKQQYYIKLQTNIK